VRKVEVRQMAIYRVWEGISKLHAHDEVGGMAYGDRERACDLVMLYGDHETACDDLGTVYVDHEMVYVDHEMVHVYGGHPWNSPRSQSLNLSPSLKVLYRNPRIPKMSPRMMKPLPTSFVVAP
jgi:hypothetical protein